MTSRFGLNRNALAPFIDFSMVYGHDGLASCRGIARSDNRSGPALGQRFASWREQAGQAPNDTSLQGAYQQKGQVRKDARRSGVEGIGRLESLG